MDALGDLLLGWAFAFVFSSMVGLGLDVDLRRCCSGCPGSVRLFDGERVLERLQRVKPRPYSHSDCSSSEENQRWAGLCGFLGGFAAWYRTGLRRFGQLRSPVTWSPEQIAHVGVQLWVTSGLRTPQVRHVDKSGCGHTSVRWPTFPHARQNWTVLRKGIHSFSPPL
ncbi:hypothetical protein HPB49_018608 [Dermacentor silvarum]|uniref:Uncharacterized protein n=1 Tax=Dermacentor silvarum TaxID=543639 RepID=A0ACB8CH08_DERSI|nr:hypothetical protein HPB49_018608 [Dermacentor silvarum]